MKRLPRFCRIGWHGLVLVVSSLLISLSFTGTSYAQWQNDGDFTVSNATISVPNPMPDNSSASASVNGYSAAPYPWPSTASPTVHGASSTTLAHGGVAGSAEETIVHKFKWVGSGNPSTGPVVNINLLIAVQATSNAGNVTWGATSRGQYPLLISGSVQVVTATNREGSTSYVGTPQDSATSKNFATPSQSVAVDHIALTFESNIGRSFSSYLYASTNGKDLGQNHTYTGSADATITVTTIDGIAP